MPKQHFKKQLLKTLTFSSLAFLATGFTIQRFAAPPAVTILIDRSYCPATQWQKLTDSYAQLHHQHRRKQIHIESVITFSDLDQVKLKTVPTPGTIQTLKTYGQSDAKTQSALLQAYPDSNLLSCQ